MDQICYWIFVSVNAINARSAQIFWGMTDNIHTAAKHVTGGESWRVEQNRAWDVVYGVKICSLEALVGCFGFAPPPRLNSSDRDVKNEVWNKIQ